MDPVNKEEMKQKLTPEQYDILFNKDTEAPFSGKFVGNKDSGMYTCAACGTELFSSANKFDSGTGWPSFDRAVNQGNVVTEVDDSHGMRRIEVKCGNCGGHLGHVFPDGPADTTGERFCINSACLNFQKKG